MKQFSDSFKNTKKKKKWFNYLNYLYIS
jgi:hypothetical protein